MSPSRTLRQRIEQAIADPFPYAALTDRERQALRLASRGLPLSAIRQELGLTERTTYRAVDSGLRKLSDHLGRTVTRHDLPGLLLDRIDAIVTPTRDHHAGALPASVVDPDEGG